MTREDAINLIGSMKGDLCDLYDDNDLIALEMAISALKESKGEWIPVSERLPEKNDVYLVAVEMAGYPQRDVDGFIGQASRKWEKYGNKVVAWMSLPEPYKAESEEV